MGSHHSDQPWYDNTQPHSTLIQPTAQGQFNAFQCNENLVILNPKLSSTHSCIPTLLCQKDDRHTLLVGLLPSKKAIFLHKTVGCHVEIIIFYAIWSYRTSHQSHNIRYRYGNKATQTQFALKINSVLYHTWQDNLDQYYDSWCWQNKHTHIPHNGIPVSMHLCIPQHYSLHSAGFLSGTWNRALWVTKLKEVGHK